MESALLVEVRPDELRLAGRPMSREALVSRVSELLETDPGRRVLVKPARGVRLQTTVDVVDRLDAAGVSGLSFIRDPGR